MVFFTSILALFLSFHSFCVFPEAVQGYNHPSSSLSISNLAKSHLLYHSHLWPIIALPSIFMTFSWFTCNDCVSAHLISLIVNFQNVLNPFPWFQSSPCTALYQFSAWQFVNRDTCIVVVSLSSYADAMFIYRCRGLDPLDLIISSPYLTSACLSASMSLCRWRDCPASFCCPTWPLWCNSPGSWRCRWRHTRCHRCRPRWSPWRSESAGRRQPPWRTQSLAAASTPWKEMTGDNL